MSRTALGILIAVLLVAGGIWVATHRPVERKPAGPESAPPTLPTLPAQKNGAGSAVIPPDKPAAAAGDATRETVVKAPEAQPVNDASKPSDAAQPESMRDKTAAQSSGAITQEKAVEIARAACVGKVNVPQSAAVRVLRDGDHFNVIFTQVQPPNTLGADYYAKVSVDANSGKVTKVLAGG
jgi:outer membrane biosynthesis protein TonB